METKTLLRVAGALLIGTVYFSTGVAAAKDATELRLNLTISNQDPVYPLWEDFSKRVEDASDGTLKISVYPTETLGKTTDMIQAISRGAPILQDSDPSFLTDYVPDFGIYMAPYLFKRPGDINTVDQSPIGQRMEKALEKQGLRIVTLVYFGTRNMMCRNPVRSRKDTANMKVRTAQTRMWNWVNTVLGGIRVNTAWSEVYTALSEGVADCVESPANVVYGMKFHELLRNYNLTQHLVAPTSIVMSQKIYESLPPKAQQALDEVGKSYPPIRAAAVEKIEKKYLDKLEAAGVNVERNVDKSGFEKVASTVGKEFPEWTPNLYQDIQNIIK